MGLETIYASEWDRICNTRFIDLKVHETKSLIEMIQNRRKSRAPVWTEEWISPIDAQFAAAFLAKDDVGSPNLIVDEGDGSIATAIGHYLSELAPKAVFEVVSNRISPQAVRALAEIDACVGVFPPEAIRTRQYGPKAGIAGRFFSEFHALSAFAGAVELFASFDFGRHMLVHEIWQGHRYPFQYHLEERLPNLAHVIELMCRIGALENVAHSNNLSEMGSQEFDDLNFGSKNRNCIMSSYQGKHKL